MLLNQNQLETTCITPNSFYAKRPLHHVHTKHLLHQTAFTPSTLYTKHHLHQRPFTPNNFYTRDLLHQTAFAKQILYQPFFDNRQRLHMFTTHNRGFQNTTTKPPPPPPTPRPQTTPQHQSISIPSHTSRTRLWYSKWSLHNEEQFGANYP